MKNLFNFATSSNSNLLLAIVVLFLAVIFLLSFYKKIINLLKEKNLQNNPLSFGAKHKDYYFKILKINTKKGIVYLGYNPTVERPYGVGGGWFKIDKIPEELRNEYSVIHLEKGFKDEVVFTKGPNF